MFIATSNVLENIPGPLRDRMEVSKPFWIHTEEKVAISKKYLIPKQLEENGITKDHVEFTDEGLQSVIEHFTAEAGLRNLERRIGSLCRKVAMKIAKGDEKVTHIIPDTVLDLLGPAQYKRGL